MRIRPPANRDRLLALDLTPMCDMVFLMLIFFLTTSSLTQLSRAQLELPQEPGEAGAMHAERPALVVNMDAAGGLIVDGEAISFVELMGKVDEEIVKNDGNAAAIDMLIRADRRTSLVHVNALAESLLGAGVRGWRLATEIPPGGGGGAR